MSFPSIDIVVVNFNTRSLLAECLGSIASAVSDELQLDRVVVVDNASTDGSAGRLDLPGLPLHLISNAKNVGFARACNQGAAGSGANYLLFLNPDTRLFESSLAGPIGFLESEQARDIGICGVRNIGRNGDTVSSTARFPSLRMFVGKATGLSQVLPRLFPTQFLPVEETAGSRYVDHVIGAFLMIRRTLFEELGGFDERFFLYYEEVDLSYRAAQKGFKSYYLAEAAVYHLGRASSRQAESRSLGHHLRSRTQYGFKHFGIRGGLALLGLTFGVELPVRLIRAAMGRGELGVPGVLAAYGRLLKPLAGVRS